MTRFLPQLSRVTLCLVSFTLATQILASPPETARSRAPELRRSPKLAPLVQAAQFGQPDGKSPGHRRALLGMYLSLWYGNAETKLPAGSMEQLFGYLERYPELLERKLFDPLGVTMPLEETPLPPELVKRGTDMIQNALKFTGPVQQVDANLGYWKKRGAEGLFTPVLRAHIASTQHTAADKARALFDAARAAGLNSVAVDAVQWSALLDPVFRERVKGKAGAAAIEGSLREILLARDNLARALGFAKGFDELRQSLGVSAVAGLNSPRAADELNAEYEKFRASLGPNRESILIRQLSPLEAPFRSCLGGSDCSSRNYFEKALDPVFAYFTMTRSTDGFSSGNATVVLGRNDADQPVAFLDKLQGVPTARAREFLEGVRRVLLKGGYTLELPADLGDSDGLTVDAALRAHVARHIQLDQTSPLSTFRPESLKFEKILFNRYSRAYDRPATRRLLPSDLAIDESKPLTFRAADANSAEGMAKELELLKEGSWDDRLLYLAVQGWLRDTDLADAAFNQTRDAWLRDASAPFAVKRAVLKQLPGLGVSRAKAELSAADYNRYMTGVLSSSLDRQSLDPVETSMLVLQDPALINGLPEEAIAKVARYLLRSQGLSSLEHMARQAPLSQRARFIWLRLLPGHGLDVAPSVLQGAQLKEFHAYLDERSAPTGQATTALSAALDVLGRLKVFLPRSDGFPALFASSEMKKDPNGFSARLFKESISAIHELSASIAASADGRGIGDSTRALIRLLHGLKIRSAAKARAELQPAIEDTLRALAHPENQARAVRLRRAVFPDGLRDQLVGQLRSVLESYKARPLGPLEFDEIR